MQEHIVSSFDEDLNSLAQMLAEMGGLAEQNVADSVSALVNRDVEKAQRVISTDDRIDKLQRRSRIDAAPSHRSPRTRTRVFPFAERALARADAIESNG